MNRLNTAPLVDETHFSIGAVTQITRIQEATLRAWERRYSFPQVSRTSGGRRQYSQQEVLRLLWVKMRMDMGMRAGGAIRAYRRAERDLAIASALQEPLPIAVAPVAATEDAQQSLLDALLGYDRARATDLLDRLGAMYRLESVILDVISPTLAAIGQSWSVGASDIAAEHFATHMLRHQLLAWMHASPPPYDVAPIVLACAPDELHEGSLLMLGALLRQLRWPVVYLGQSLPLSELPAVVTHTKPALVVFVAMSEAPALALAEWPHWLAQQTEAQTLAPIIGIGGRAFSEEPALAERIPGVFLGSTLRDGYQRIHWIMLNLTALDE